MGSLTEPTAIVSVVSIALAIILTVRGTKGGLLISIVVATIVGIPLGVTALPTEFDFVPDFSALCAPFQQLPDGSGLAIVQVFVQPVLLMFVFSLLMSDFFDTMGTVVAVGSRAGFVDKKGDVEDVHLSSSWIRPRRQPAASSERAPSRRSWNPSPARQPVPAPACRTSSSASRSWLARSSRRLSAW